MVKAFLLLLAALTVVIASAIPNAARQENTQPIKIPPRSPQEGTEPVKIPPRFFARGSQEGTEPVKTLPRILARNPQEGTEPVKIPPREPQEGTEPVKIPPREPQEGTEPVKIPPRDENAPVADTLDGGGGDWMEGGRWWGDRWMAIDKIIIHQSTTLGPEKKYGRMRPGPTLSGRVHGMITPEGPRRSAAHLPAMYERSHIMQEAPVRLGLGPCSRGRRNFSFPLAFS
ncbi:hypothetical protein B0H13DRAFT_1908655 [Mycena leptocephala]|nr:hypothetical protein B0H13DRAFT_1908655 [Mycena leptocephala]